MPGTKFYKILHELLSSRVSPRSAVLSLILLGINSGIVNSSLSAIATSIPTPSNRLQGDHSGSAETPQSLELNPPLSLPASVYRLGPGDQIDITVLSYQEFTGLKVILSDGTITLPIIGSVNAANRSPDELAQELNQRLRPFLRTPVVTVAVVNTRPLSINVAGAVQRPGLIQLRGINPSQSNQNNTPQELPTVTSALIAAGGVARNADIRQVTLRRTLPAGESVTTTINLWESLWSDNTPPSLVLQDGDTLFIPELASGDTLDQRLIARSNLAPQTVRVRVVGEVKRPGEVAIPPSSSLSTAVATAGGPTVEAAMNRATFVRLREDGTVDSQEIDLSTLTDTYQIQEGDVVIIPRRGVYSVLDLAGRFLNPLNVFFNLIP